MPRGSAAGQGAPRRGQGRRQQSMLDEEWVSDTPSSTASWLATWSQLRGLSATFSDLARHLGSALGHREAVQLKFVHRRRGRPRRPISSPGRNVQLYSARRVYLVLHVNRP
jgi:hypothetical protein